MRKRVYSIGYMKVLVFKTDITTPVGLHSMANLLDKVKQIIRWSVDTEDVDNVLRIVAREELREEDILKLTQRTGHFCAVLND